MESKISPVNPFWKLDLGSIDRRFQGRQSLSRNARMHKCPEELMEARRKSTFNSWDSLVWAPRLLYRRPFIGPLIRGQRHKHSRWSILALLYTAPRAIMGDHGGQKQCRKESWQACNLLNCLWTAKPSYRATPVRGKWYIQSTEYRTQSTEYEAVFLLLVLGVCRSSAWLFVIRFGPVRSSKLGMGYPACIRNPS